MPQTPERKQDNLPLPASTTFPVPNASASNGRVTNDVSHLADAHPLAHLASKYNDEPLWDDFLEAMQEVRCQMNKQVKTTE